LAVSRTFGDAEAKLPKYNGIPNVISAEPDIFSFKINEENDFLILACIFYTYIFIFKVMEYSIK
jgi:protein phosphatase 2C family protein 2/3